MVKELIFKPEDKILVITPHQDDETIGCGGLLLKYGTQCDVVLVTDGSEGIQGEIKHKEDIVRIRTDEFELVMNILKINSFRMLGFPDGSSRFYQKEIQKILCLKDYDYILVPNRYEKHTDHQFLYKIVKKNKKVQMSDCQVIEYEVWSPMANPNRLLDISEMIEKKVELLRNYKSQLECMPYESIVLSLNGYRGALNKCKYAEAYNVFDEVQEKREKRGKREEWYLVNIPKKIRDFFSISRRKLRCILKNQG